MAGGLFSLLLLMVAVAPAFAITLTPDQMKQVQQLSPAEREALAKQAGVELPSNMSEGGSEVPQVPPVVVQPAAVGVSAIEISVRERLNSVGAGAKGLTVNEGISAEDRQLRNSWETVLAGKQQRQINSNISQYGYELFAGSPTTFAPATEIPVPPEYVMGPGDELNVQFYGSKEERLQVVIDREGIIDLPSIGPLTLVGLNFQEAKALIAEKIHQQMIGVTGSVSMGRLRSMRVFVLGDVNNPGSYLVSGLSTISNALFVSGGISKKGSLRHVMLKRAGQKVAELDLYDFLLNGNSSNDSRLQPGDVVFVPPIGDVVSIAGVVTRPAIYELRNRGAGNTVADILILAGGKLAAADIEHAQIDRLTSRGDRTIVNVDVAKAGGSSKVRNGDIVLVYAVPGIESDTVFLTGHVKRPGSFGLKKGMKLSDIIPSKDVLLPYAFMDYMIIQRTDPVTGELTILRPSLGALLEDNYKSENPELRPDDKLMVFSNAIMNRLDSVYISGAVYHPGSFPLGKGMNVSDLILAAGGPVENAYLKKAELTRYEVVDGEKRKVNHIEVDLAQILSGDTDSDLALQAHDVIMVRSISNWNDRAQIVLKGEFRFPGSYTVEEGESVEDVIERAGGLTDDAYPVAAYFTRESIRESQTKQLEDMISKTEREISASKVANKNINDPKLLANTQKGLSSAEEAVSKMRNLKPQGRLLIDMDENGNLRGGSTLSLVDGDTLYVPKRPDQVMVIGEVYNQSAMLYRKNMDTNDFIDLAGGTTKMADAGSIYIVRANGYVDAGSGWSRSSDVYPGDTIVVPQKLDAFNLLDSTLDWSKVLMQIGIFTASMVTVGIL